LTQDAQQKNVDGVEQRQMREVTAVEARRDQQWKTDKQARRELLSEQSQRVVPTDRGKFAVQAVS